MSAHLNDQELIDSLKLWWKKYGNFIVIVVLGIAVGIAVWRYWENVQTNKLNNASVYYQALLNDVAENQTNNAVAQANFIISHYSGTPYANMAALFLAQNNVGQGNLAAAQQQLQHILNSNSSGPFQAIAALRLARIDLALQQPQAALALLSKIPAGYEVSYNLVRGDAYAQMQQYAQASSSYQAALKQAQPTDQPLQNLIHLRISAIPATH